MRLKAVASSASSRTPVLSVVCSSSPRAMASAWALQAPQLADQAAAGPHGQQPRADRHQQVQSAGDPQPGVDVRHDLSHRPACPRHPADSFDGDAGGDVFLVVVRQPEHARLLRVAVEHGFQQRVAGRGSLRGPIAARSLP